MDGGSILLIAAWALHQIPNLVIASKALAAGAFQLAQHVPTLVTASKPIAAGAFQLAEDAHTAVWLATLAMAVLPKGLLDVVLPKLFEISHKFKIPIRVDTARGSVEVDARNTTLEETRAKIDRLNDHGDGSGN
jgi:hypothetical protein